MVNNSVIADEMFNRICAGMWFEVCDAQGWPNGLPTWEELCKMADAGNRQFIEQRTLIRRQAAVASSITIQVIKDRIIRSLFEGEGYASHGSAAGEPEKKADD